MRYFTQIDENNVCTAMNSSEREVIGNNIIEVTTQVESGTDLVDFMWRKYENSIWSTDKFNPNVPSTLVQFQSAKKAQLQTMYAQTLAAGFISSASGTVVTYGFAPSDQDNMTQIQSAISAGIETWPVEYGDVHGNVIPLTQDQFTVLETDANRFKWAQVKQLRALIGQAMVATTNDAVNAVQWTAGMY